MILTPLAFLWLGWLLARRAFPRANVGEGLALAFTLALALFLIGAGLAGRVSHSFSSGILLSGLASFGISLILYLFNKAPTAGWKFLPWNRWKLLWLGVTMATTGLIAMVALRFAIFDEVALQGHLPVVESMLRDHFPPSYSAFPEVPYRYHFGFNMLAAYISLLAAVPGFLGIDLATLLYWIAFACLLPVFFRRFGVSDRGLALGFILVAMTGGLSWLLFGNPSSLDPRIDVPLWQSMRVYGRMLHPHFMMYLFQHPMGLGMVFFLGAVLAFDEWFQTYNRWALAIAVLILGALSLTQVVLFVTLLASLSLVFGYFCLFQRGNRARYFLAGAVTGAMGLVFAFALGGFFSLSPHYENQPLLFSWPPGYLRWEFFAGKRPITDIQSLRWYLSGFGLFLLLIPLAWLFAFRRKRTALSLVAVFGILSFLVPQFFRYSYSWDIIKWLFAFELSGKLLVAVILLPWCLREGKRTIVAWILICCAAVTPVSWLWDLACKSPSQFTRSQLRVAALRQPSLDPKLTPILQTILASPSPWGVLWANPKTSLSLLLFSGLSTIYVDGNTNAMPVSRTLIRDRIKDLENLEASPGWPIVRALGVDWIYFTCAEVQGEPSLRNFLESLRSSSEVKAYPHLSSDKDCFYFYRIRNSTPELERRQTADF